MPLSIWMIESVQGWTDGLGMALGRGQRGFDLPGWVSCGRPVQCASSRVWRLGTARVDGFAPANGV